ncbi:uncharacterized protein LOC142980574 [Anticarsia gemmatalis]|uniref:uncharacterized protein LOC142980574 n=1 Tax=Anticarsia gemmatalis TaxID=129554 RepID=UPI003F774809
MAQYNFEGDIDDLTDPQKQFIDKIINEQGFENSKVIFEPLGKVGDNYVAGVKRLTIQGKNGSMKMIAKLSPIHEMVRQFQNTKLMFKNEHTMYTEVLPKFVQLQKEAGVPEEELFRYPKCYGSFTEYPHEVMLFEDLKVSNFKMLGRFNPLPNDYIKLILRDLAVLHSLSHVCRKKEPEAYESFKENLIDMIIVDGAGANSDQTRTIFQFVEYNMISLLEDPDIKDIVKGKVGPTWVLAAELAKAEKDSEHSVVVQGDAWTNNLMFNFENDAEVSSIMIDYQRSRVCSPVYDIMFMIFNGSDHEARKKHFHEWIDYYHSELGKSLAYFDLDVNSIYPRDVLDADMKRYGIPMFGLCLGIVNILVRKSEEIGILMSAMQDENMMEKIEELCNMRPDDEVIELFRSKIAGLVASFKEFGLL